MKKRALVSFLTIAMAAPTAAQQQPPARDGRTTPSATTVPSGTAVLGGHVADDDGRPVRFAHVVLIGTVGGFAKVTSTDADGKFTFANLPADRYTLGVSKPPYLAMVAGAKRPGRPGTAIAVANGQKITNVSVRMVTGGAITGVITDEKGQPGVGAMVGAFQWRMQNGERTLVSAGNMASSDDEGRYRIYSLLPGEYFVSAMRQGLPQTTRALTVQEVDAALEGRTVPVPPPPAPLRFAPVYFPGTTRAGDAVPITVNAGEERNNADIRLELVTTSRVEGTVVTAAGQPASQMIVIMASAPGSVLQTAMTTRVTPDGRFQIPNAQPGSYVLIANPTGPLAGQFARAAIEVAGADIVGVQLALRPAMTMTGRLAFDAAPAPDVTGRRIPFRALGGLGASVGGPQLAPTDKAGTFTVSNLTPGRYVLGGPLAFGATTDTMTWTLQSVVIDGRDVTDLPIEIGDAAPKDVVVTYTGKWQELSGRLQSQSGAPVSDYTIIVFPEDRNYWIHGTRRIVVTRPGTDGSFTLSGKGLTTLPPGKYLLAAVTDVARDEQFDPAFLAQIVPAAVPLTLGSGEKKVQNLAIK